MTDDFLAGVPTRHAPLLGVGASLDRLMGGADLWTHQRAACHAACDAFGVRSDADCYAVERAIDAYLRSMRAWEQSP